MKYNNMQSPRFELKLNLSPPRANNYPRDESPRTSVSSMEASPPSSCVSREPSPGHHHGDNNMRFYDPSSPEMMLVGCPQCLMYVMLSTEDPKCPQCKSTVLLDFFHDERIKWPAK